MFAGKSISERATYSPPSLTLFKKGKAGSEPHHVFLSLACFPLVISFSEADNLRAGIYLSELRRLNKLFAVIDPTRSQ